MIELPLPEDEDLFHDTEHAIQVPEPSVFPYLVRLMVLVGRINNVLNGRRGRMRTLEPASEPNTSLLSELQTELVQFSRNLPPSLRWSVHAFKQNELKGQGGIFLQLHLWINAILTLTYHPDLIKSPLGFDTPVQASLHRSAKLSLASARLINESLVFADLCGSHCYVGFKELFVR